MFFTPITIGNDFNMKYFDRRVFLDYFNSGNKVVISLNKVCEDNLILCNWLHYLVKITS